MPTPSSRSAPSRSSRYVSAGGREDLDDYRGLGRSHPWLAAGFTILLLAQAGVPFTTGFLAKLGVLEAAIGQLGAAGVTLGVLAMIATAIGGYYYLRLVVLTYAAPLGDAATPQLEHALDSRAVARLATVGAGILVEDDRDGPSAEHPELAHLPALGTEPDDRDATGPEPGRVHELGGGGPDDDADADDLDDLDDLDELDDDAEYDEGGDEPRAVVLDAQGRTPVPVATAAVVAACVIPTVVLGIWAGPLAALTAHATMLFGP